jgi:hypothetical protein
MNDREANIISSTEIQHLLLFSATIVTMMALLAASALLKAHNSEPSTLYLVKTEKGKPVAVENLSDNSGKNYYLIETQK